jgi:hypothetical protein
VGRYRVAFSGDGRWHSYVLVVNATTSQSLLYVDGVQGAALASAITTSPDGTAARLGRQFDPAGEYFGGDLADVQIYAGALSAAQVAEIAAAGPDRIPLSLPPPRRRSFPP